MTEQLRTDGQQDEAHVRDLMAAELEQATGGTYVRGGLNVALGDGSVRTVDGGDLATWRNRFGTGI